MTAAWSRFIALVAFTSAIASGIAMFIAYVLGYSVLPPIIVGGQTFVISLITTGFFAGLVYAVSNVLDAFAPQVSAAFNRLSFIGSAFAFAAFTITSVLTLGAYFADGVNIQRVLEAPGSIILITGLWLFALIDVFVFQRLKNRSLARHEAANDVVPSEVVHDAAVVSRTLVPLIGRIEHANIYYYDCRGKDVTVSAPDVEGGFPRVSITESASHAAA